MLRIAGTVKRWKPCYTVSTEAAARTTRTSSLTTTLAEVLHRG